MSAAPAPFPTYTQDDWRKAALAALKGGALEKLQSRTSDGVVFGPIHGPQQGPRPLWRAPGDWKVLTRVDHVEAAEANAGALEDLAGGADGLQVVFAGAAGAYGYGLPGCDSATLHRVFEGVRFEGGLRLELDLGYAGAAEALAVAALLARLGAEPEGVDVAFGLDPIGARLRSGKATEPWTVQVQALGEAAAKLKAQGFRGPFAVADARPVHAAGGTSAQELGFALAAAVAYWRALGGAGFAPEAARSAISFRLAADADQLVTLSKFRALRLVWAGVERAAGLEPEPARIHAESAWRMMSAHDPYVNVMRVALAAFSAGLGGADSVALLPFSRALGLPDSFARRLARNAQLVELREAHLGFVEDPAAGAGVFEELTRGLAEKAWGEFQALERAGGAAEALLSGEFQNAVRAAAAAASRDVARLKSPITGVSAHPQLDETRIEVRPYASPATAFPGESFAPPLEPERAAAPFERLRDAAEALPERPKIFLAAIGPPAAHSRRVSFARDLFEAGGVAAEADPGAADAAVSAERFRASGARLACLCGSDEDYAAKAADFAAAMKAAGAAHVILAGRPGEHEALWRGAGVDDFVFAGQDALTFLTSLLKRAGAAV